MADGRRGRSSRPKKQKNRQFFASEFPQRKRSKRKRLSGIVPWGAEVNFDANAFINLEIDLNKDQENPRNPKNPSIIYLNLNGENPKESVIENNGATYNKHRGPFNVTALKNSVNQLKSEASEVSHMYYKGVLNDENGRKTNDDLGRERVCRFNTKDLSVVLELNGREFGNSCEMGRIGHCQDGESASGEEQLSVPCNGIESNKDDQLKRVLVSLLDDDDEHGGAFQSGVGGKRARKRARKRTGLLRRRKQVVELDQYLDTHIIDRYMEQLWKKLPKDKKEHSTYLDCLWFSMYLEESTSFKILKWIKAKRIFSKRYVFIPIVHWGHWNLLILCHFGEDLSSEVRTPCMLLLDSLKGADPSRLEPLIRKFLVEVHKGEGRKDSDKFISRIPLLVPEVPQQTNGNDCGVFLLHFIDLFLKRAPQNFSTSDDCYPYFLTKDWFKLREIRQRRKHINDVLLKEHDGATQMITRRISTRSKKLNGFLGSGHVSNWIDLSSAA